MDILYKLKLSKLTYYSIRGDLAPADRKTCIAAVQCLMTNPSKLPAGQFPGAYNRYEDFVVTHMKQTLSIHGTVCFSAGRVSSMILASVYFYCAALLTFENLGPNGFHNCSSILKAPIR